MTAAVGTLHGRLLAVAATTPGAAAILSDSGVTTYGELDRRSALLAEWLTAEGVGPGVPVGVCAERTPDLLVAILGILRSGAAYLPLDPKYPDERLRFMVEDSGTRLVLTTPGARGHCPRGPALLVLDGDTLRGEAGAHDRSARPAASVPVDSAYVIYTSGSTGQPKGVPLRHSSCGAMLDEAERIFAHCDLSGVAAVTSICFDLAVMEIFAPLSAGGAVVLLESAVHLAESPHLSRVTHLNTVPSVMTSLLDAGGLPPGLRSVVLGGETVRRALVDRIYRETDVARVFNGYGPTEGTVFCTFKEVPRDDTAEPSIGTPSTTARLYVLDTSLRPVPEGEPGELYLGGAGLTWGYLNRPRLTAERFVPDPHADGEYMYRTGDVARRLPGGELAFAGRVDHQVKVRGYRIELEEAEARLSSCPEVREAAVAVRAPEGQPEAGSLVAYVVPRDGADTAPGDGPWLDAGLQAGIRRQLGASLPDHMVPDTVVFLAALPVSPNGKLDRAALPVPPAAEAPGAEAPASTPTQVALSEIWGELLSRDAQSIGLQDTFYELGGNSLLLVRLARRMTQRFGRRVGVADLFRFRDIASLATWLDADGDSSGTDAILQARRRTETRRTVRDRGRPSRG
ncbi:amino acid adenylation domain-containing protein [Streptomyces phaeolivaceus]|uniref:Amino acid adenylation domain-containing protein n=1 Tax=Streptomyces phaeolivaceus TaxID=2653200 RepID=A0A5P8KBP6_9ACTN|nr:non-ribosomal peptide synthetase [Streptomyces phaeolivaceus]QFR00441.1 amino acid adenylation domain-containing protein [Streptomyces phaeolivaceus]